MADPLRLLVVCLGNICRSPMAEGALRARLHAAGWSDAVQVDSAGTGGWHVGDPPDPRAVACAARNGVDIAAQRARQLQPGDFSAFDVILCADRSTLRNVRAVAPGDARAQVLLLSQHAHGDARDVPDPYTGGDAQFDHAWALVDGMARAIVDGLRAGRGRT